MVFAVFKPGTVVFDLVEFSCIVVVFILVGILVVFKVVFVVLCNTVWLPTLSLVPSDSLVDLLDWLKNLFSLSVGLKVESGVVVDVVEDPGTAILGLRISRELLGVFENISTGSSSSVTNSNSFVAKENLKCNSFCLCLYFPSLSSTIASTCCSPMSGIFKNSEVDSAKNVGVNWVVVFVL